MKKQSIVLKETRESKLNKMGELLEATKNEDGTERAFSSEETETFDTLEREIKELDKKIELEERKEAQAERVLQMKAHKSDTTPIPGAARKDTKKELYRKFSIGRAVKMLAEGKPFDGAEKEIHDIALEEARKSNINISGFGLPGDLVNGSRTHYTAGTAATAGNLIKDEYAGLNEALIPKLMIEQLGGKVTTGNVGNIVRVKAAGNLTASWKDEETAVTEQNTTFSKSSYSPEKLGALTYISKQMLIQDGYGLDQLVSDNLRTAIKIALDAAAINGSGSSNEPAGILSKSGIATVALGTNGAVPTWADILSLEKEIELAYADVNNMNFLTTPGIKSLLKATKKDAGSGLFVWDENKMNGYNAYASTQVPSTLTKGTSSGNCHAILFGDFSKVELAQWGGIDLTVNPYTYAKEGYVQIVADSFWNVIVDYPEYFAVIVDALLS